MRKKYFFCFIALAVIFSLMLSAIIVCADAPQISATQSHVTATNVPDNAALLVALYENKTFIGVLQYNTTAALSVNFREDMKDMVSQATDIKAFLWDMSSLRPLCDSFSAKINELPASEPITETGKTLVIYFSCTNTTENIANYIVDETSADTYKIEAAVPYTAEDLAYYTGGRADKEQADESARPQIANLPENLNSYNTIFLGYPIWHGAAPKIIYTFLESYDFTGKTIIPFCTSHSSNIGSSDTNLHPLASGANWIRGRRFGGGASKAEVVSWVNEAIKQAKER